MSAVRTEMISQAYNVKGTETVVDLFAQCRLMRKLNKTLNNRLEGRSCVGWITRTTGTSWRRGLSWRAGINLLAKKCMNHVTQLHSEEQRQKQEFKAAFYHLQIKFVISYVFVSSFFFETQNFSTLVVMLPCPRSKRSCSIETSTSATFLSPIPISLTTTK